MASIQNFFIVCREKSQNTFKYFIYDDDDISLFPLLDKALYLLLIYKNIYIPSFLAVQVTYLFMVQTFH